MDAEYLGPTVSAMWLSVALLAGGFARTRNRSALVWFVLTVFLGPIAVFLLVVWPPADPAQASRGAGTSTARSRDEQT